MYEKPITCNGTSCPEKNVKSTAVKIDIFVIYKT